jgi:hypothetical protein
LSKDGYDARARLEPLYGRPDKIVEFWQAVDAELRRAHAQADKAGFRRGYTAGRRDERIARDGSKAKRR